MYIRTSHNKHLSWEKYIGFSCNQVTSRTQKRSDNTNILVSAASSSPAKHRSAETVDETPFSTILFVADHGFRNFKMLAFVMSGCTCSSNAWWTRLFNHACRLERALSHSELHRPQLKKKLLNHASRLELHSAMNGEQSDRFAQGGGAPRYAGLARTCVWIYQMRQKSINQNRDQHGKSKRGAAKLWF